MILLLASLAVADTITLDTGVTLSAELARYEAGGDCQFSVTDGELQGVIVIVSCARVSSFTRVAEPLLSMHPAPAAAAPPTESLVEAPLAGPLTTPEAPILAVSQGDEPAEAAPAMPDSIGALRADDFTTPFPAASTGYEVVHPVVMEDDADLPDMDAEAEDNDEDADDADDDDSDEDSDEDSVSAPSGTPRPAPAMPATSARALSF